MQPRVRINEAARALGVSPGTLRAYEQAGRFPRPILRNHAGQRVFSPADLEMIARVLVPGETPDTIRLVEKEQAWKPNTRKTTDGA